ncbi:hypothetical protein GCM10011385_30030 [Nitratireductor aestuarii]|uniref:Uncharacterized protein n=1 Tax=Nitratireductor aestuarii TaxID=1735103 RepID=A0A916RZ62_9HYPH|nr:hypothetical protein [Nitratireductor aestuarii]GGA74035.1 hypothetical protein GCM10011385_30030 [Nitratireductor aestuarii]
MTMVKGPGNSALAKCEHTFNLRGGSKGTTVVGTGSISQEFRRVVVGASYASVAVVVPEGEIVNFVPGAANTTCNKSVTIFGDYVVCNVKDTHDLLVRMGNLVRYEHYIKNISGRIYELGVANETISKTYPIGTVTFMTIAGIGPSSLRHRLSYLSARSCALIPYVEYRVHRATAVGVNGLPYAFNTQFDPDNPWGDCDYQVDTSDGANVLVRYKIP